MKFIIIYCDEIQQKFYETPLHHAVKKENIEIIKLLLENNEINIHIKDDHHKEPIEYTNNNEIKQMLNH